MAETTEKEKPTKVKYKFGADELDLQDYLNNLEHNVQSYLNSLKWNDGLKLEFSQAYRKILSAYQDLLKNNSERFSTDSLGWITDTQGEFSNKDNDNIDPAGSEYYYDDEGNRITTGDYNNLKKRKQKKYNTFSANREVANFFNTIGNALAKARRTTTTDTKKFNLAKNGFEKWFNTKENPAGGKFDFAPYIEKDEEVDGVRGTAERSKYLAQLLLNYLDNLEDLDYSESTYKDKETYADRIKAAINNLNNGYNSEDAIALRQAGLSNEFLDNFFSTGKKEDKTEAELAAEDIAKMLKEQLDLQVIDLRDLMRAMLELNELSKKNPFKSKYSGYLEGGEYDDSLVDIIEKLYPDIEGNDNKVRAWLNFELILNDLKNPILDKGRFKTSLPIDTEEGSKEAMNLLRLELALKLKFAAKEDYMKTYGDNEYIIPGSEDYSNYTLMTYNPITGEYKDQSILLNLKLKEAMAYDWYKKNNSIPSNKNGGIVEYFQKGGFIERAKKARELRRLLEQEKEKAKEAENKSTSGRTIDRIAGRTKQEEIEGSRKLSEGLEWDDYARLGAIALDLTSAISAFGVGAGTVTSAATGVGSTLATLGADLKDGFQWSDLGTAGYGLGMDLVGLIPGFGTAGKVGKIAKNLVKFAPYVLGVLQAKDALSEPSRKSWDKLLSGKFKEVTIDDLRNIASGVTLVASAGLLTGTRLKNAAMKKAARTGDNLIEDKTGEMLRISPGKLEAILKAKSLEEANKILLSIPGYENRELASKFRSNWNPVRLWNNNPKVAEHYDWSKLRGTKFDKKGWLPSDADIFEKSRSSNLGHLEWHFDIKNPYSKYLTNKSKNETVSNLPVPTNPQRFHYRDKYAKIAEEKATELRDKINKKRRERIKNIDDEHFKKSGPGTLTSSNELETVNADQLRFINNLFGAIPTMTPRSSGSTPNLPAVVPKLQIKISSSKPSPFDSNKIKEGLARAEEERLGRDIGNTRAQRAIEANSERVSRLLALEASNNVRKAFNTYGTPLIKKPLTGAARKAKENMYSLLFGEVNLVTEPIGVSLVPKTPRKPTLALHNKKLEALEKIWTPIEGMTKSPKGILRALRKAEAKAEAQAKKQAEELAEKSAEERKRIINELPYISESKKREMANGKKPNKKPKKTSKDVNIKRRKEGGTLDLNKVRKFDIGGGLIDIANLATRLALSNGFFSTLYKQKKLTGWDPSKDNSRAGGTIITENAQHGNAEDLATATYKNMLYTANSDLVGLDLQSYYDSSFKGKSLEDYVNEYNLNASKIRSFWNLERVLNDIGATEHNRLFRSMFSNRSGDGKELWDIGYDDAIEDIVGSSTWLRRMDRYEKNFEDLSDEEKKSRIHKIDLGNGNTGYVYKKANGDIGIYNPATTPVSDKPAASVVSDKPTNASKYGGPKDSENPEAKTIPQMLMEGINKNPTLSYGLIRAMALDRANRRMTEMAKESINPLLKDPFEIHRYTRSDLDAEIQGERNYADIRRLASRPLTSDGSLLIATLLQGEVQGLAARTAGKEKSNQTLRQYDELAWQQEKENAANRHETAMFNRALLWGALLDKAKLDLAYLSKRANIWDTFAQQLEYDARVKQKENKALADRFTLLDISKEATYNLAKYAPELSPAVLDVWNQVISGNTTPSELQKDPAKWLLYQQAMRAKLETEYDLFKQYYGINSPFGRIRLATNTFTPSITKTAKKGGILSADSQIAVAGIKAKTADAERFQRQIKECIDRNEKAIDRLSKSLYGIIKASILK